MSRQQGFTLIEVIIALAVVALTLLAVIPIFVSNLTTNTRTEIRSQAAVAAQQTFDQLRIKDPSTMPSSGSTDNSVTVDGRAFTVRTLYCQTPTYCTGSAKDITVQVFQGGSQVFSAETIFTQVNYETN